MTQNNSNEMKTVVETFIIEETQELIYDGEKLDQWNKHVAELGLTGQTKIVSGDKSPIPFMHLKQTHVEMFKVLCPRQVNVKQYNVTPIPVEILDLVALSVRENYFSEIEIWYDDKNPDPICVGCTKMFNAYDGKGYIYRTREEASAVHGKDVSEYAYEKIYYLLGKWADVKASFSELKERAKKRFIAQKKAEIEKTIKDSKRELDDLESKAIELMGA